MAIVVNETKLNAAMTATADAIRAKTGDSAQIPFDYENGTGFADAVEAIPQGGGGITVIPTVQINDNGYLVAQWIKDQIPEDYTGNVFIKIKEMENPAIPLRQNEFLMAWCYSRNDLANATTTSIAFGYRYKTGGNQAYTLSTIGTFYLYTDREYELFLNEVQ